MLNVSPEASFYFEVAVVSLFAIFLLTIFWGTKMKYFKDYGEIKRSKKKKG